MKSEISVLRYINSDGFTTQRDIARLTGMSLGNVNAVIKRLILKGFLQKRLNNERVIKYILTEEGKRKKALSLHEEYTDMICSVSSFQRNVEGIIKSYCVKDRLTPILLGEEDQLQGYLIGILNKLKVSYKILDLEEFERLDTFDIQSLIFVWHPNLELELKRRGTRYLNILEKVDQGIII